MRHVLTDIGVCFPLDSNGGVISSTPIPHICPCSLQCDSTTTTTTTTTTSTTTTTTTTIPTTTTISTSKLGLSTSAATTTTPISITALGISTPASTSQQLESDLTSSLGTYRVVKVFLSQ